MAAANAKANTIATASPLKKGKASPTKEDACAEAFVLSGGEQHSGGAYLQRYGMVWYGMVWYDMVWYGMVWYGMVWYGMVWYGMVRAAPHNACPCHGHGGAC